MRAFYAARVGRQAGPLEERFGSPSQGPGEPFPRVLVARNPESQPVRSVCERAGENSSCKQPSKGGARVGVCGQSKEGSAADDSPADAVQESVEPRGVAGQARARCLKPVRISERANSDRNCWAADGP